MRFKDKIDAQNIEYNNPFARQLIRDSNQYKDSAGVFYREEFDIAQFCIQLLIKYFPLLSGVWSNYHDFAHVSVLKLVRQVFEYGFFTGKHVKRLASLLSKVCNSLKKLEDSWNQKCSHERDAFVVVNIAKSHKRGSLALYKDDNYHVSDSFGIKNLKKPVQKQQKTIADKQKAFYADEEKWYASKEYKK